MAVTLEPGTYSLTQCSYVEFNAAKHAVRLYAQHEGLEYSAMNGAAQQTSKMIRVHDHVFVGDLLQAARCDSCKREHPHQLCSRCRAARYCDAACQRQHWAQHKGACQPNAAPIDIVERDTDLPIARFDESQGAWAQ